MENSGEQDSAHRTALLHPSGNPDADALGTRKRHHGPEAHMQNLDRDEDARRQSGTRQHSLDPV
eukprot:6757990-Pyramimonas_sp.AAC.1